MSLNKKLAYYSNINNIISTLLDGGWVDEMRGGFGAIALGLLGTFLEANIKLFREVLNEEWGVGEFAMKRRLWAYHYYINKMVTGQSAQELDFFLLKNTNPTYTSLT